MVIGLVDMLLLQFSQSYYKIGLSDRYLTINYLQGVHSISSFISDLCQIDNFIQITFSRTLITSQDVVGMLNRVSMKYRNFYRKFNDVKSLVETYLFLTYFHFCIKASESSIHAHLLKLMAFLQQHFKISKYSALDLK